MNFEKIPSVPEIKKETAMEIVNNTHAKKAFKLLEGMKVPNKKTIKKVLAGMLTGVAATAAVETQNNNTNLDIKERFTPELGAVIDKARGEMTFGKNLDTKTIAAKLDIPVNAINEGVIYTSTHESVNEDDIINTFSNGEVSPVGDDIYFISKTALATTEEISAKNQDKAEVNMYNGFITDTRTFTFNGVEIEPVGQPMSFESEGVTKSDAILSALEEGIGFAKGTQMSVQSELTTQSEEKITIKGDEILENKSNVDEKFVDMNSSIVDGFVDHYEVESIEQDENGMYHVKLKIVFGERLKYQLPDGVELASSNGSSYYEITPQEDTQEDESADLRKFLSQK
jgi:hypothetical protein